MLVFNPFLYIILVVIAPRSQTLFGNAFLDAPRRMFFTKYEKNTLNFYPVHRIRLYR